MQTNFPQLEALTRAAEAVSAKAYAPYSHFFVGAAILLESGEIVTGCNVENASFRLTCCAEQTAVASAVARYGPSIRIQAVVVVNRNAKACSPCGACRQTLVEFSAPTTQVAFPAGDGRVEMCTMQDLLPSAFRPASLPPSPSAIEGSQT